MAMMLPILGAASGSALGLAATGVTALGQIAAGQAAADAASTNARAMRAEADIARQQGNAREEAQRRRAREVLGQQRAAIGQAGIGWGGSASDVLEASAAAAELDALNVRYESELQARGLLNQASLTEWEGKQAKRASRVAAASTILGGAANYFGKGAKLTPGGGTGSGTITGGTGLRPRASVWG